MGALHIEGGGGRGGGKSLGVYIAREVCGVWMGVLHVKF